MQKLIQGILDFKKNLSEEERNRFATLALGQKPDALFVACSDSRVAPNVFVSTNPGDLFVVRNPGNFILPFQPHHHEHQGHFIDSGVAALLFALQYLTIKDIIICGHSECGAIKLLSEESTSCTHAETHHNSSPLRTYLEQGASKLLNSNDTTFLVEPYYSSSLSLENRLSQKNTLLQLEHLKSYPLVRERLEQGTLSIHAWWFDIAKAEVSAFNKDSNTFLPIA